MPVNPSAVLTGSDHSPPPGDVRSLDSVKGLTFNGRLPVPGKWFTNEGRGDMTGESRGRNGSARVINPPLIDRLDVPSWRP
jgi:hypothetical protein